MKNENSNEKNSDNENVNNKKFNNENSDNENVNEKNVNNKKFNIKVFCKKHGFIRWLAVVIPMILGFIISANTNIQQPLWQYIVIFSVGMLAIFLIKFATKFTATLDFNKVGYDQAELLVILKNKKLTPFQQEQLAKGYIEMEKVKLLGKDLIKLGFIIGIALLCGQAYSVLQFAD